jgi:predicted ATP-grasp superfamily ATP-dependent carboligase
VLLERIERHRPEAGRPYVLLPIYRDTRFYARHRERFEAAGIRVAAPDAEALARIHPKDALARTLRELDVPAPRTWLPEDLDSVRDLADELPFPVFLKPHDQTGGRGIHKVDDAQTLLRTWRENREQWGQPSLIQEAAEGEDHCVTALFDHGELRAHMAYRNVYRFPRETGAGILRETIDDTPFLPVLRELMGPLRWNGVAEFDFLWTGDADATPALIEVNPRFWGGLFQSVESGIDFPWLLYELCVRGTVAPADPARLGTRTKTPVLWLVSALQEVVEGDEPFAAVEARGREVLGHLRDGELRDGVNASAAWLASCMDAGGELGSRVKDLLTEGRDARSELLDGDDPWAALGVLFVLGSLLRHGRLPREVRF